MSKQYCAVADAYVDFEDCGHDICVELIMAEIDADIAAADSVHDPIVLYSGGYNA